MNAVKASPVTFNVIWISVCFTKEKKNSCISKICHRLFIRKRKVTRRKVDTVQTAVAPSFIAMAKVAAAAIAAKNCITKMMNYHYIHNHNIINDINQHQLLQLAHESCINVIISSGNTNTNKWIENVDTQNKNEWSQGNKLKRKERRKTIRTARA